MLRNLLLEIALAAGATIVAAGCSGASGYSDKDAVPASQAHVFAASATRAGQAGDAPLDAPDDKAGDPLARNFSEFHFMTRGFCYAASQAPDASALGGFGPSKNAAHPVRADNRAPGLYLLAQPQVVMPLGPQQGMRLALVNQTEQLLGFHACDSRLEIIQEAQNADGAWQPIEYLPPSDCGNSYHHVYLAPHHFWEFAVPRCQGSLQTKLRFSLVLDDKTVLHSNEFAGSVHPEQFTVHEGHTATNLMDPYND